MATKNTSSNLPFRRNSAGRWDTSLAVATTNTGDCFSCIRRLQIEYYERDAREFDLVQLAKATDGYTGAEIEIAFVEAMYPAFETDQEPMDLGIAQSLGELVPLSRLMVEQIAELRTWARGRTRPATTPPAGPRLSKLAVG
jgi:hypothetical protein